MSFTHFSRNGQLLPLDQATIDLRHIEYCYGFGVYESIRVSKGTPYFVDQHIERLLHSARVIGLEHAFEPSQIIQWINELVQACDGDRFNLKILLIGARAPEEAEICILPLNPLFPEKRTYTQGVKVITVEHERFLPQAKTLNMLPSYLAYQQARKQDAEDALLINKQGCIVEGTKANVLAVRGQQVISPPFDEVLDGVTRRIVLHLATQGGYIVSEEPIALDSLGELDGLVLTSSSLKVVPIAQVDDRMLPEIPESTKKLMKLYDELLDNCEGRFTL